MVMVMVMMMVVMVTGPPFGHHCVQSQLLTSHHGCLFHSGIERKIRCVNLFFFSPSLSHFKTAYYYLFFVAAADGGYSLMW
jgi:hypothetical protein